MASTGAQAHSADALDVIDVVTTEADGRVDLELTVGLGVQVGDAFHWVCHEAVTAPDALQSPRYRRTASGAWLAWLRDAAQARDGVALWRSTDGCAWQAATGLAGLGLLEVDPDPLDAGRALAVARDPEGLTSLLASTDGGASWSPVAEVTGAPFGVRFDRDGVAWVGARGDAAPEVWRRAVEGTWTRQVLDHPAAAAWVVAASGDGRAWAVVDPDGVDAMFATTDGGATWSASPDPDGEIVDGCPDGDGGAWWIVNGDLVVGTAAAEPLLDRGIGLGRSADSTWFTSHPVVTGWLAGRLDADGVAPVWTAADVTQPLACPADSDVARVCAPLWPSVEAQLAAVSGGGPRDTGDTGGPGGAAQVRLARRCGCVAADRTPGAGWGWAVLLVGLRCRRR